MLLHFEKYGVPQVKLSNIKIMFRIDRVTQMNFSNIIIMFRIHRVTQVNISNILIMFRIDRVTQMTGWSVINTSIVVYFKVYRKHMTTHV